MLNCLYCLKECVNANSHRNHERLCPKNPARVYRNGMEGKTPWNKGLDKSDPRVKKNAEGISKALKGKPNRTIWTEEMRRSKSEWRKKLHRDFPETHPNRRLAGNRKKMSYPEKVAYDYLMLKGVDFQHQKQVLKYYPDFVIGDIIVEIDGVHWHNEESDRIRDCDLIEVGYKVFRIKSTENIEERLSNILRLV